MDVVIRQNLCDGEKQFTVARKKIVRKALKNLNIDVLDAKNVPRVALLGSGGGQRANVGFLGVIQQLNNEDLLNGFHYVAGVSGSTWCMSSLYQNSTWSENAGEAIRKALLNITEGRGPSFHQAVQWLRGRDEDGNLSLSDVWGAITCRIKGASLETRPLTADRDERGANPYPLYSTVEKDFFNKTKPKEMWFEFSPHESGFLQHGAYVETSLLNKDFQGGYVKPPQKKQVDIVQLQGMCGCAMGDKEYIEDAFWKWIHSISPLLLDVGDKSVEGKTDVVFILADLMESYADTEHSFSELERLKVLLGDHYQDFSPSLKGVDRKSWGNMTDQDKKKFVEKLCDELAASADKWGPLDETKIIMGVHQDVWWVFTHIIPKFSGWHFGNMPNFLYRFQDPAIPKDMTVNEQMHLIDAGLYLNSPYPSVLGKARDIDLIISFDFSAGDPFETLKVATKYAAATGHPFPKVDFTELDSNQPKSYYVFEEKGKPTVIHIPLFNMDNCKDQETIKREKKKYKTIKLAYKAKAKVDHLAHLAGLNVSMNKYDILEELQKAVQRRSGH